MTTDVLIVDDHPIVRRGLVDLLENEPDFTVVGTADDGRTALDMTAEHRPDLVVMDVRLPELDGLEATRRLTDLDEAPNIVILTISDDEHDLYEAVKAGAQGYILKDTAADRLVDHLQEAARGEPVFTDELAARALVDLGRDDHEAGPDESLTARERDVLREVADGYSNEQIGERLDVSKNTVRFHLRNILSKLHARNRTEAAVRAVREGLIDSTSDQD